MPDEHEHCWHRSDHQWSLTVDPPIHFWEEVCCWCGELREVKDRPVTGPIPDHGPFYIRTSYGENMTTQDIFDE